REIGPVHDEVLAGRGRTRLAPRIAGEDRETKRGALPGRLEPAEDDLPVRAGREPRLAAAGARGHGELRRRARQRIRRPVAPGGESRACCRGQKEGALRKTTSWVNHRYGSIYKRTLEGYSTPRRRAATREGRNGRAARGLPSIGPRK